jgi:hypothetical protein
VQLPQGVNRGGERVAVAVPGGDFLPGCRAQRRPPCDQHIRRRQQDDRTLRHMREPAGQRLLAGRSQVTDAGCKVRIQTWLRWRWQMETEQRRARASIEQRIGHRRRRGTKGDQRRAGALGDGHPSCRGASGAGRHAC